MRLIDAGAWDWDWALRQFDLNRHELNTRLRRQVGFGYAEATVGGRNGEGEAHE
jgi:hypothetical protein